MWAQQVAPGQPFSVYMYFPSHIYPKECALKPPLQPLASNVTYISFILCLFQLPPPGIDFTLPSPTIGLQRQVPIDPPWQPHFKTKIEEVTVNQDQTVRNIQLFGFHYTYSNIFCVIHVPCSVNSELNLLPDDKF